MIRVTVFAEHGERHRGLAEIKKQHPEGLHRTLKDIFDQDVDLCTVAVCQDDDDDGKMLTDEILQRTDVLVWWGHTLHEKVSDTLVEKIVSRVLGGMGCIFLHSAHMSKPFRRLMGTGCTLKWREMGERERLWVTAPGHPIAEGLPETIAIEHEEMYGEYFDIPKPDEIVFLGWFQGGEVFRSGVTYTRGKGKIFYFQPGHESNESYHHPQIQHILKNAVHWAAPCGAITEPFGCPNIVTPFEKL